MNKKKSCIFITIICAVTVIYVSALWYYKQLQNKTYQTTIANIHELANHDQTAILSGIRKNWKELSAVHYRMKNSDYRTLSELQKQLHIEQNSYIFEQVYYATEDGTLYSGDYSVFQDPNILNPLRDGAEHFVRRYSGSKKDTSKEELVYGISIEPWQIENITFVAILCRTPADNMKNELIIESYDGNGYSSMIDENGDYVINVNRNRTLLRGDNFFTSLENGTFPGSDITVDDIRQKLHNDETFTITHATKDGRERVIIFNKIEDTAWYFVMVVSNEVFLKQTHSMMRLSSAAIFIIVAIIIIVFILIYVMMRNTMRSKSQLEARNDFLSNMSHEIRTPLNGLIGLNHLMVQHIDDREKTLEHLHKSSNTAQYLLSLVNDILDMSKLQAGRVELHLAPANINMIIDNVASMQRSNIESRGIHFQIDAAVSSPCIVCDEIRIKQVLMNLLSNAAKFTPAGGNITFRIRQEAARDSYVLTRFEVIDTGCGMSREFCEHIFEAFTQERNKNSESQKGTGLGMAISYLLMKEMGGSLSVESELGVGSHFTASFSAPATSEEVVVEEFLSQEPSDTEPLPQKELSLLIAEDNELNAEILIEILADCGIRTDLAVNGREAVDKFAASKPGTYHVILMDVQMPVLNGYDATKAIRSLDHPDAKKVTIFACTANTFQEDIDKAAESGMDDFLGKPIDVSELLYKLKLIAEKK